MFLTNKSEEYSGLDFFVKSNWIKSIVNAILGEKMFLFNEKIINTRAHSDRAFLWHQDYGYGKFDRRTYLSIWIPLIKTTVINGALRLIPVDLTKNIEVKKHNWSETFKDLDMDVDENQAVICELEENIVFFTSKDPHAFYLNKSEKNRITHLYQYFSESIDMPPGINKKFRTVEI